MAKCEVCHNEYDKAFEVTAAGPVLLLRELRAAGRRDGSQGPRRLS
jgi:hypothetical protein